MTTPQDPRHTPDADGPDASQEDIDRREVLKRLGQYALYTPPAMVTLLRSRPVAASVIGPGPGDPPFP